jgi:hypothetical protein
VPINARIRVEPRNVADLKAAEYNPRRISKAALKGLTASMEQFGVLEPIIVNERTGNVVGGHQRLKGLEAKGVVVTDCVIVDFDEATEKAANVTLNNPNIAGTFETDGLAELLAGIKADGDELFKDLRLDRLSGEVDVPEVEYVPKYEVVVTCQDEAEQEELFTRLQGEGRRVKVLTL